MLIKVKAQNVKEIMDNFDTYNEAVKKRVNRAVNGSLNAVRRGARRRIHSVTGTLSKRIRKTFDARVSSGTIRSYAPHNHLVEFGTKGKGEIKLNKRWRKKAMRLPNGRVVSKIRHTGMKAKPFMRPSYEEERPRYIQKLEKAVKPRKND